MFVLGYEYFWHENTWHQAGGPSETLFDISGKTLYSGRSLVDHSQLVEFKSSSDKAIINDLPKTDMRYDQAVEFAQNNHYFKEHEDVCFDVVISSTKELPDTVTLTLENAFFEPIKTLETQNVLTNNHSVGPLTCKQSIYRYMLGKLEPGVYHFRCRNVVCDVEEINEFIAFEVMPNDPKSKPAPLLSGLPYIYCSCSEIRGLETDHFDPWRGSSVNVGHYISCSTFKPGFAKRNKIWDTLHLYGREWFVWLTDRTTDDFEVDNNVDIVKNCDYISPPWNLMARRDLLNIRFYKGELLECLIRFVKTLTDNACSHLTVEKLAETEECLAHEAFYELTVNYWDEWLDFVLDWHNEKHLPEAMAWVYFWDRLA